MRTQILICTYLLSASLALGQSYRIRQTITASGGTRATSASYTLRNTIGQPAIGPDNSPGYHNGHGFWYQYNSLKSGLPLPYSIADGWNMISLPLMVADYRKSILYPT